MKRHLHVLSGLLVLTLFCSACNLQNNMLYYPASYLPSQLQLAADGMRFWPSGPEQYRGFAPEPDAPAAQGTIIVFHGNAGSAFDRTYYRNALAPFGFRVILAEYPGYGGRPGRPGEKVFVQDAGETIRIAANAYGGRVYLLGESLGCGVAAAAAGASPVPIDGMILITPWDTLQSVAAEKFPWLPVRLFLSDKYDSVNNLRHFQGRIAVIGAERDEVIPVHHASDLFRSLPGNKRMWIIGNAGHNDWPGRVSEGWWKEITDFVAGSPPAQ